MKINIPHGDKGHFCHGGCAGYAKGGKVPTAGLGGIEKNPYPEPPPADPRTAGIDAFARGGRVEPEQPMESLARNREEIGLPPTEGGLSTLMEQLPIVGPLHKAVRYNDIKKRLENPELLHNTVGAALETNFTHGGRSDTFGKEGDVQMMAEGGEVMDDEDDEDDEDDDPSMIPEDIKEFVQRAHKAQRESRPDENWRITPPEKAEEVAPYKPNEDAEEPEEMPGIPAFAKGGEVPGYADGGDVPQQQDMMAANGDDMQSMQDEAAKKAAALLSAVSRPDDGGMAENAPINGGTAGQNAGALLRERLPQAGQDQAGSLPGMRQPRGGNAPSELSSSAPGGMAMSPASPNASQNYPRGTNSPTEQDFLAKASNMLGLNPGDQAAFMKVLGDNAQKGQIGAGIAGIGDAIASGGTLGKVNPGNLERSENLIQGKESAGLTGMQTIRGNQEKTTELSQKLQAQDPKSPLSRYAQKAYAGIGKKLGLDLTNASAALISDISGKGVDALNTEYQNQLKMMGLDLQKKQVEATIGNQKAEREIAREGHQAEAAKTLADRGVFKTLANAIPGTAGHAATQVLEKQATGGGEAPAPAGPVKVNSMEEYKALPTGTHYVDSYGKEKVKK